jgi:hypothetical protein
MKRFSRVPLACLLLTFAGLALTGCSSMEKPGSGAFASVVISGHTPEQIRGATVLEFEQDGYTPSDIKSPEMVFEKEGTRWDQVAYGSWMTKNVWIRVKVWLVPAAESKQRLQCQAYRVRDKGEPLESDPAPLRHSQNKPYQELMDKIASRLARY